MNILCVHCTLVKEVKYYYVWLSLIIILFHAIPITKLPKHIQEESGELEKNVWFLNYSPYVESISMEKIIEKTAKDETLIRLRDCIQTGSVPPKGDQELMPYRKCFSQLAISDEGLLLKDDRIILPQSLHNLANRKVHQGADPAMKRRVISGSRLWISK